MWFEDLPPAPPAPDTIGVLDEEEGEGLLALGGDPDRRPRWGRKPMVGTHLAPYYVCAILCASYLVIYGEFVAAVVAAGIDHAICCPRE